MSILNFLIRLRTHQNFRALVFLIGVVIAVLVFEEITDDVFQDPQVGDFEARDFDARASQMVHDVRSESTTRVIIELTALGSISVVLTLYVIFVSVLISFRDYRGLGFITVTLTGAGLWPMLLKFYFQRVRPDQSYWLIPVSELSYPSGHSFGAAAVYIGFAYYAGLYARGWRQDLFFYILGSCLAFLVGVSRIYLGVHYPTDVLAGLSGGIAWALIVCFIYEFFIRRRSLENYPVSGAD